MVGTLTDTSKKGNEMSDTPRPSAEFVMGQLDKDINDAINGLPTIWRAGFRDRFTRLLRKAVKLCTAGRESCGGDRLMSDTPRTDAAVVVESCGDKFVYADFAQKLEREVNALHAQIRLMDSKPTIGLAGRDCAELGGAAPTKLGFADAVREHGDDWLLDDRFSWEGKLSAHTRCALNERVTQDFKDYRTMKHCTSHGRLFQVDV